MMKGTYPVEIRFKDIDLAGHVHNSVYLSYFEQARMMLFAEFVSDDWDWKSKGLILARNEIDYILPVHLGDKIHISIECDYIGTKSFTLSYRLFSEDDKKNQLVHTTGRSILVCMDYNAQKTIPVYKEWIEFLEIL